MRLRRRRRARLLYALLTMFPIALERSAALRFLRLMERAEVIITGTSANRRPGMGGGRCGAQAHPQHDVIGRALRLAVLPLAGLLVWVAHFLLVHGAESVACSSTGRAGIDGGILFAVTAVAAAMQLLLLRLARRLAPTRADEARLVHGVGPLCLLALFAVLCTALSAAFLSTCPTLF